MTKTRQQNKEMELAKGFVSHTGCNIFLTGKAGTGKTTFLQKLQKSNPKRMIITAPTGVAAINAGGVTLHSFFQMPFGPFIPGSETTRQHKFNREKINVIKGLDLLVIDEISMVRSDLLDGIDSVLRRYRRSNLPFGGVQLLCIGDLFQLPPVVKDGDWQLLSKYYETPYFFSSNAIKKTDLICIELQHIYRQADEQFINLLNQVRNNQLDNNTLQRLNARYRADFAPNNIETRDYITLCTHNKRVDSINSARLDELKTKTQWFSAEVDGDFPEHSFPTAASLELKVGAQVMFVRNDASLEKRYFNGKIGKITHINPEEIRVECSEDFDEIIVEQATWENIEYSLDPDTLEISENKIGAFSQFPLKLAWAITIHKSQGLTFDQAIIDAQAAFAHGQVYVALSRCRSLEGLILSSQLTSRAVKTDTTILRFVEHYNSNPVQQETLKFEKIRYEQKLLLECFNFKQLQNILYRLVLIMRQNSDLVKLSGVDLAKVQEQTVAEICTIGTNFQTQLGGYFEENTLPSENTTVIERIFKGSKYFQEKLQLTLEKPLLELYFETDNKEIRKKVRNLLKRLDTEIAAKLAGVTCCEDGFSATSYLKAISSGDIKKPPQKRQNKQTTTYSEADVGHPELYQLLKDWRNAKAKGQNLTPYQIIHLKTLIQIAVNLPDSPESLIKLKGIGPKLLEKYGEELSEIVKTYKRDHKIDKVSLPEPQQQPPSVAQKEVKIDTKKQSFMLHREGLSIQQIADKRSLAISTIEGHLCHFVEQGELSIDQILDPQKKKLIERCLKDFPDKRFGEIKHELGGDVSYGEIKIVIAHQKNTENTLKE